MRIGVLSLTGCSGCQCEILNCQEALFELLTRVEFSYFPLIQDANVDGSFDLVLVEGSVSTRKEEEKLREFRDKTKLLVAIGSCACYGGVQAQRNDETSLEELLRAVYGTQKPPFEVSKPKAVSQVVKVDYELPGCPVDRKQFVYAVSFLVNGVKPFFPKIPVCHECKLSENECLLLKGMPCQGPVTYAGCGAPCTLKKVGCQGCRGNCDFPNFDEILSIFRKQGIKTVDAVNALKVFRGIQSDEIGTVEVREYEKGA